MPGTPTSFLNAKENDVIMGRGKRVSEWPGNIHFRKVVLKHRNAYMKAHRVEKTNVAQQVIDIIHKSGGRFMQEADNGDWEEIEPIRAMEKCCQALREKDRGKLPMSTPPKKTTKKKKKKKSPTPILDAEKALSLVVIPPPLTTTTTTTKKSAPTAAMATTATSKKRAVTSTTGATTKKKARSNARSASQKSESNGGNHSDDGSNSSSDDDTEDMINTRDEASAGFSESGDGFSDNEQQQRRRQRRFQTPKLMDSPVNQVIHANEEDMITKLVGFKRCFGHCAVPPAWPSDPLLADWCTAQRLYRRIAVSTTATSNTTSTTSTTTLENGEQEEGDEENIRSDDNDEETKKQLELTKRLDEMGFVWDYDEWHWEKRFNQFLKSYKASEEAGNSEAVDPISVQWLQDQRRQQLETKFNLLSSRLRKFQDAGIFMT